MTRSISQVKHNRPILNEIRHLQDRAVMSPKGWIIFKRAGVLRVWRNCTATASGYGDHDARGVGRCKGSWTKKFLKSAPQGAGPNSPHSKKKNKPDSAFKVANLKSIHG